MGRNLVNFHYFFAHRILFYGVGEPGSLELRIFITGIRKMDSFWDTRFSNFCSEVWGWVGGEGVKGSHWPSKNRPFDACKILYLWRLTPEILSSTLEACTKKAKIRPTPRYFCEILTISCFFSEDSRNIFREYMNDEKYERESPQYLKVFF